jgi:uncharacterized membrane protein YecN with MAPEG domain
LKGYEIGARQLQHIQGIIQGGIMEDEMNCMMIVTCDQVDQILILLLVLLLQGVHPIEMVMQIVGLGAIQTMHLLEECQGLRHVDLPIQKRAMVDAWISLTVIAVVVIMTMFLGQNVHIRQWKNHLDMQNLL